MANNNYISDELLAAYLDGNTNEAETLEVLNALRTNAELQETLDIALRVEEVEQPALQMAAEGRRNLCDVQCEAYVLKQKGFDCNEESLFKVAKENHWIRRAGTPLQYMGNLLEHNGLKVTRKNGSSIEDVTKLLKRGDGVIVAVDSDKLYPEKPDEEDATNHAIVVTGIDNERVTIYDPENITEVDVKLPLFMSAWRESRCYLVSATIE